MGREAGMSDVDQFCRDVEAHLCRRNGGHLIRLVGPSFECVYRWAEQGIPLQVAQTGIDRYVDRQQRKPGRRRPVRVEFCEADVLDAFDDWRRAVGVSGIASDPAGGPPVEEPTPVQARGRRSLPAHLDRLIARLTVLRGSDRLGPSLDEVLRATITQLDRIRVTAEQARGEARQAAIADTAAAGEQLFASCEASLSPEVRQAVRQDAAHALAPYAHRLSPHDYDAALSASYHQLLRDSLGLPDFTF
jgi:hypothetical protein